MNKPLLTLILTCATAASSSAQQAVGAAGGRFANGATIIEYNIGEAVIGTVSNGGTILTQGFEQPWVEITTLVPASAPGDVIDVYPNPARHYLNIRQEGGSRNAYSMLDARGREVLSGRLSSDITELDTEKLASGSYVLRIMKDNAPQERSFRIIIAH